MKRKSLQHVLTAAISIALGAAVSNADPVSGQFANDSRGDSIANIQLPRELGDSRFFQISDALIYHDHRVHFPVPNDDGIANDWLVHITNVSGQAFQDLFFVADAGATIGNADGTVHDAIGAPGVWTDAFRIDSVGTNANLIMESILADGILQSNEEWEFVVTNFNTGVNSLVPTLTSPGVFSGSSPMQGIGGTNASILGVPVPEPSTLSILALMALASMRQRRRSVAGSKR
jgi:hypothetical protein